MAGSEFTPSELEAIKLQYASLAESARKRCSREAERALIDKAFELALKVHARVRDRSGAPHILHCIQVAKIVVDEIGLGYKSICAALLHDIFDYSDYTPEQLETVFGSKITSLVSSLSMIKTVLDENDSRNFGAAAPREDFRNILITLGGDVRVVLVKLADRLHNCRNIEYIPSYKRSKVLSETMEIFIPLSHRLGLYGIKTEMENIWLRFKEPEAYEDITRKLAALTQTRSGLIDEFLQPVRSLLDKDGMDYEIKKRVKSPYSIWYKIRSKGVSFEQISDLFAVRIIFTPPVTDIEYERSKCFHIFSLITSIYPYRPDRVRNWLTVPKRNGYEALHLTCITRCDIPVEVQIRSKRMDEIAEKGISAHWNYKRLNPLSEESPVDKWLSEVRDILENTDVHSMEELDLHSSSHAMRQIFIFDENDCIKTLPYGITAREYSRSLGEEIASRSIAVKINYRLFPLDQRLCSADKVELITTISSRKS